MIEEKLLEKLEEEQAKVKVMQEEFNLEPCPFKRKPLQKELSKKYQLIWKIKNRIQRLVWYREATERQEKGILSTSQKRRKARILEIRERRCSDF